MSKTPNQLIFELIDMLRHTLVLIEDMDKLNALSEPIKVWWEKYKEEEGVRLEEEFKKEFGCSRLEFCRQFPKHRQELYLEAIAGCHVIELYCAGCGAINFYFDDCGFWCEYISISSIHPKIKNHSQFNYLLQKGSDKKNKLYLPMCGECFSPTGGER